MRALIIGQGIAGTCLAWELEARGVDFLIVDRSLSETASRVAAGLVNPLTGKAFRPGWRQEECLAKAFEFYPQTEAKLNGSWWQKTPIFRELETSDQEEIWHERQLDESSSRYAGPLFPWPENWHGKGQAGYTRGAAVLHVENMVNAARATWQQAGKFREAEISPGDILPLENGQYTYAGESFTHVIWCTGWEAGKHPAMLPLQGRPSKGTIIDVKLHDLNWEAGILHFGHWLVHHGDVWRFGATYGWAWDHPGEPEAPAVQELIMSLSTHYSGHIEIVRSRAAIRPIVRRSQPVAGPIPHLPGQYVFSGLGSKGVTTAPWTASTLADHLVNGTDLPADLLPTGVGSWK